jgi:hypothetical protein
MTGSNPLEIHHLDVVAIPNRLTPNHKVLNKKFGISDFNFSTLKTWVQMSQGTFNSTKHSSVVTPTAVLSTGILSKA